MKTNRLLIATMFATASLLLLAANVQAQGHNGLGQQHLHGDNHYGQAGQHYRYPSNQVSVYYPDMYGTPVYYPSTIYSTGFGSYGSFGNYGSYRGYGSGMNYRSGYGSYGYPSRTGFSIRFGTSGSRNRGFGGSRGYRN